MSMTIFGTVSNGVVVPNEPLPEGASVEIHLHGFQVTGSPKLTPGEIRRLPRTERQAILATAAALAEEDYRTDTNLTGFEAFREEDLDVEDSDEG